MENIVYTKGYEQAKAQSQVIALASLPRPGLPMHVSTTYHPTLRRRNAERTFFQDLEKDRNFNRAYSPRQPATLIGQRSSSGQIGNDELVLNGAAGNL